MAAPGYRSPRGLARHVAGRAYVVAGTASVRLRLQPDFILIGGQRCGTTSLFRALVAHPQVFRPSFHKGINYFDLNYYRSAGWYRGHFPLAIIARRRTAGYGRPQAFEASGYYSYHPFAVERIAHDMPHVKLVIMLRNPVDRAFSAYKHEFARGFEHLSFEEALELEDSRLAGEIDRIASDLHYESFAHRHHSYRHRGHYSEQLERVFQYFPREQVHIIDSETFFADPAEAYRDLLAFLGLRAFELARFDQHNARPSAAMAPGTRRTLEEYFRSRNAQLAVLLRREPLWAASAP